MDISSSSSAADHQREEVMSCNSKAPQTAASWGSTVERKPRPNPDLKVVCPRCESTNTKFCYYNNYSMSQPRYFCKACRRYWTHGGSLRNVPIGGGCRKNKRSSSASPSSSMTVEASKINKHVPLEPMVPPLTCTDFPNVLPTFVSAGCEVPQNHLSLAFASSSSSPNLAVASAPGGTFLDILRGGILDGHLQNNDYYGPTSSNVMVIPPSTFGVGGLMHHRGIGGTSHAIGGATTTQGVLNGTIGAGEEGDDSVKAMMGLHLQPQLGGGGGGGSAGGQQGIANNVTMDGNNSSSSSSNNNGPSRDCYWNNGGSNPWQGLINSSSLM